MENIYIIILPLATLVIGYLVSTIMSKNTINQKNQEIAILETQLSERDITNDAVDNTINQISEKYDNIVSEKESWEHEKLSFLKDRLQQSHLEKIKAEYALNMRGKDNEKELKKLIATTIYVDNKTVFYDKKLDDLSGRPEVRFQPTADIKILADAKAPLDPFDEYFEALDQGDLKKMKSIQSMIAENIKKHIEDLSKKGYHKSKGTFPYVLMFLPSDMHEQVVRESGSLIQKNLDEYAFEKNILISGPRNFLSDLAWAERLMYMEKNNEIVEDTVNTIGELFLNVRKMIGHLKKQTKSINETANSTHLLNLNFIKYLNVLSKIKENGFKNEDLDQSISDLSDLEEFEIKDVRDPEDKKSKIEEIED